MKNRRNYYRILHVQEDAPEEIIRTSYRTLMQRMRMHPDLGGDHRDASLINEAYATLIDPQRRAEYDLSLPEPGAGRSEPETKVGRRPTFERPPPEPPTEKTAEDDPSLCLFCRTPHGLGEVIPQSARCGNCNSPLYPAVKRRFDERGKRAIGRTPRRLKIACVLVGQASAESLMAMSEDISLNGMALTTEHAIPRGSRIKIECDLLGAVAEVRNCSRANEGGRRPWRIGVEFLTLVFTRNRGAFVTERV